MVTIDPNYRIVDLKTEEYLNQVRSGAYEGEKQVGLSIRNPNLKI